MNEKQWNSNCKNNNLPFNFTLILKQTSSSYCIYRGGNEIEGCNKFFETLVTLMIWFTWTSRNSYTHTKSCEHTQSHTNTRKLSFTHWESPRLTPCMAAAGPDLKGICLTRGGVSRGHGVCVCMVCACVCVCVGGRLRQTDSKTYVAPRERPSCWFSYGSDCNAVVNSLDHPHPKNSQTCCFTACQRHGSNMEGRRMCV